MGNVLTDLFSTQPAQDAANDIKAGYTTGATTANNTLASGQTSADQLYGQAYSPFSSLISSTGAGATAYGNATGVNGQAGIDAAGSTFKSLPGYSGGLTTGIDQVMRTNAAAGNLGGGNNTADEIKFASDYDANKYGNYVSSLAPYLGANQSAISGAASVLGNEATTNTAIAGQQAQNSNAAAVGAGNAQGQADLAPYSASQNFWSSMLGLGKLAVGAATGGASLAAGGVPGTSIGGASGPTSFGGASGPMPLVGA